MTAAPPLCVALWAGPCFAPEPTGVHHAARTKRLRPQTWGHVPGEQGLGGRGARGWGHRGLSPAPSAPGPTPECPEREGDGASPQVPGPWADPDPGAPEGPLRDLQGVVGHVVTHGEGRDRCCPHGEAAQRPRPPARTRPRRVGRCRPRLCLVNGVAGTEWPGVSGLQVTKGSSLGSGPQLGAPGRLRGHLGGREAGGWTRPRRQLKALPVLCVHGLVSIGVNDPGVPAGATPRTRGAGGLHGTRRQCPACGAFVPTSVGSLHRRCPPVSSVPSGGVSGCPHVGAFVFYRL